MAAALRFFLDAAPQRLPLKWARPVHFLALTEEPRTASRSPNQEYGLLGLEATVWRDGDDDVAGQAVQCGNHP